MPTKRRKIGARAIGRITEAQRTHLVSGAYLLSGYDERDYFRDEAHRRATWAAHRAEILRSWDLPGRRPEALWRYDCWLKRRPWPKEWSWPKPIQSESWMVHHLLTTGQLEPCQLNGCVRIASEIAEIEGLWRHEITMAVFSDPDPPRTIGSAMTWAGTPPWFYREHAPEIIRRRQEERAAWAQQIKDLGRAVVHRDRRSFLELLPPA